jgi:ectoine hydroxylase-related dioxygenase (phytanoyl-CoA dioxygenase family)
MLITTLLPSFALMILFITSTRKSILALSFAHRCELFKYRCSSSSPSFSKLRMSTLSEQRITNTADPSPQRQQYPIEMTEDERYLFDLNGYLIVRGVLSPDEVSAANAAIDRHTDQAVQRNSTALRNAVRGTALYGTGPGRKDLGRVLEWGKTDSAVFKSILAHPRLVPIFHGILGKGYRMDHLPFVIMQDKGAEGFQLHGGTVDCTSGEYNPHLAYTCHHNMIRSALLGCNVMLTDHDAGDGGFCVVPGSHKSNFKMPKGMVDGETHQEFIRQPKTKAGDVVLFSEGTVHGAMAWTPENKQRRVCLYRFAPATNTYGRSYFGNEDDRVNGGGIVVGWPKAIYDDLTDEQKAVLEPPYANRLDRPNIKSDRTGVEITSRNAEKMNHDRNVFGTKYF